MCTDKNTVNKAPLGKKKIVSQKLRNLTEWNNRTVSAVSYTCLIFNLLWRREKIKVRTKILIQHSLISVVLQIRLLCE